MKYRETQQDIPQIAKELSVDHILEGSVNRSGNLLRITVHLIQTNNNSTLWAEKAIELDSSYALAYAELVRIYEVHYIRTENPSDIKQMLLFAEQAYQINPNLIETLRAKHVAHFNNNEYQKAYFFIKKAFDLNPNDFATNYALEMFFGRLGFFHEASEYEQRALQVNPLAFDIYYDRAFNFTMLGQLDGAKENYQKCLEIKSDTIECMIGLCEVFIYMKDYPRAEAMLNRAESLKPPGDSGLSIYIQRFRALYYAAIGNADKALELEKSYRIYAMLGMPNEALADMRIVLAEKDLKQELRLSYLGLTTIPLFDSIRSDSRFQEIIQKRKTDDEKLLSDLKRGAKPNNNP